MTRRAQVLRYVNRLRAEYEIGEPLSEMPPDLDRRATDVLVSQGCPVAVALGTSCGARGIYLGRPNSYSRTRVNFPKYVTEFIDAHDRRVYGP